MNEQDLLKASHRWSNDAPADAAGKIHRVKGRLMQAETDLYRVDNLALNRVRDILVHEVTSMAWLIEAKQDSMAGKPSPPADPDVLDQDDVLLILDVLETAMQMDGFMDKRVEPEARPLLEMLYAKLRARVGQNKS